MNIIYQDCLEGMCGIPTGAVNLIVTSPPYANVDRPYGVLGYREYIPWFLSRSEQMLRILSRDGSFILNIKENAKGGERHRYVYELVLALRDQGWKLVDEYIWHKSNSFPGRYPARFRDAWEHIYHFSPTTRPLFNRDEVTIPVKESTVYVASGYIRNNNQTNMSNTGSGLGKDTQKISRMMMERGWVYPDNVLWPPAEDEELTYEMLLDFYLANGGNPRDNIIYGRPEQNAGQGHSAMFPEYIPEFFIKLCTDPGDLVLDPFTGSGTTNRVANRLGRFDLGFEIVRPEHEYNDNPA